MPVAARSTASTSSPADMPAAATASVASGRSRGFSTCSTRPASVSITTMPFAASGESANENVSVEPAYQVRLETFWNAW